MNEISGKPAPEAGPCAYCGELVPELTEDHVIPRAWSGNADAAAAAKWKVPACRTCNNRWSKIERELTIAVGLTTWTDDDIMGDVAARATRSVKPSAGRNEKDRAHRRAALAKLRTQILPWAVVDQHPNSVLLGEVVDRDEQLAFNLSGAALRALAEKIVRGVWFLVHGSPVKSGYEIDSWPWRGAFPLAPFVAQHGRELRIGRSVVVRCASPADDAHAAVFEITLWERLAIAAFITPPDRVAPMRPDARQGSSADISSVPPAAVIQPAVTSEPTREYRAVEGVEEVELMELEVRARALAMLPLVEEVVARRRQEDVLSDWTGIRSALGLHVMSGWRLPLNDHYAEVDRQCSAIADEVAAGAHQVADEHRALVAKIYRLAAADFRRQCIPGCSALVCEHDREDAADGHLKSWVNREDGRTWVWLRRCHHGQRLGSNHDPDELERALPTYEARGFDCSTIHRHVEVAKTENTRSAA